MYVSLITVAYREKRFIGKFLRHIPNWIDRKVVLMSEKPWFGKAQPDDGTKAAVLHTDSIPVQSSWATEHEQRNTGLSLLEDSDWVIVLDPDEFLSNEDWNKLYDFLQHTDADAVVCEGQYTYWKDGWVADPPRDYQMLIAVRPNVQFVDKRVVNTGYAVAPVWVHHFSWARTDEEVWSKISHYAHAEDFDIKAWFKKWKSWKPGMTDMHPVTPETLHEFKKADLPSEIEELNLWP